MTSGFLQSLSKPNSNAACTTVAQEFMRLKGYPDITPLGVTEVDGRDWYFYYQLPEGILEVEVTTNADSDDYRRGVSAFVTDRARVRELLGT